MYILMYTCAYAHIFIHVCIYAWGVASWTPAVRSCGLCFAGGEAGQESLRCSVVCGTILASGECLRCLVDRQPF